MNSEKVRESDITFLIIPLVHIIVNLLNCQQELSVKLHIADNAIIEANNLTVQRTGNFYTHPSILQKVNKVLIALYLLQPRIFQNTIRDQPKIGIRFPSYSQYFNCYTSFFSDSFITLSRYALTLIPNVSPQVTNAVSET